MPFLCSICGEESTRICVRCTKDSCNNHLCERCRRCSDCCECEVALSEPAREPARAAFHSVADRKQQELEHEREAQSQSEAAGPLPPE